jgi:regulator of nucleoside diphosphate kinase
MEMTMITTTPDRQIVISAPDARVLRTLLERRRAVLHDQEHLDDLYAELDRAIVLDPSQLCPTVVTMYAALSVRDLESGERLQLILVSPAEADVAAGRISVLAPLGTALLGYRTGDVVERSMPGGLRRLLIEQVVQPSDTGASHTMLRAATAH